MTNDSELSLTKSSQVCTYDLRCDDQVVINEQGAIVRLHIDVVCAWRIGRRGQSVVCCTRPQ